MHSASNGRNEAPEPSASAVETASDGSPHLDGLSRWLVCLCEAGTLSPEAEQVVVVDAKASEEIGALTPPRPDVVETDADEAAAGATAPATVLMGEVETAAGATAPAAELMDGVGTAVGATALTAEPTKIVAAAPVLVRPSTSETSEAEGSATLMNGFETAAGATAPAAMPKDASDSKF